MSAPESTRPVEIPDKLDGWKEIAAFFGIQERTARRWEVERNLPVHRFTDADKSRVWASRIELRAWQTERDRCTVSPPTSVPAAPEGPSDRRTWLRTVVFGSAALGVAGAGFAMRNVLRARKPVACRVEGRALIALDQDGKEVWRQTFPDVLANTTDLARTHICADLNGDGKVEVLYRRAFYGRIFPNDLLCFSEDGKLLWQFAPNDSVKDKIGREFRPPYSISDMETVPGKTPGALSIALVCLHNLSYPCEVTLLDSAGKPLRRYWHRGHLNYVTRIGERLVVGGVNDSNEYKQATLVMLDPGDMAGGSASAAGEAYFEGVGKGSEIAEVFFPRTRLSESQEFNRVAGLSLIGERLHVAVAEGAALSGYPLVIYDLDFDLQVRGVSFTDYVLSKYIDLAGGRRAGLSMARQDEERCRSEVRVIRRA